MSLWTYNDFAGDWTVEELPYPRMSDAAKMGYYPPKNQILTFSKAGKVKSKGPEPYEVPYFKVTADQSKPDWPGRAALEGALFLFGMGIVTSTQMKTQVLLPGSEETQSIHEVITLENYEDEEGKEKIRMLHAIIWEDGDMGKWGCR
ncbi:MAG: hypothetical protein GKR91_08470 [Pseudomonadales bacterium]|nr:hypothetical protein [Pseudomonadales bacterium]